MLRHLRVVPLLFVCLTASAADKIDYANDVLPILRTHCIGCHNAEDAEGGLDMRSHAAMIKGGESGLALTRGEPGSSRMILMLTGKLEPKMPPEGEQAPSEDQIATLAAWIEQGARGPDGDMPIQQQLRTPKIEPAADVDAPITAIALSNDGQLQAIARFGAVEIRRGHATLTNIDQQPGKVNSLQFSADGSRILLATGLTGAYGRAAVYSTSDGKLLAELIGHRDTLYSAVFSPDESLIATAGYDRDILLWDASTGEQIREFVGHNGAVFDLAFSPDGTILVSACADETAKVWQVSSGRRLDTLSQPEGEVFAVDITPDGKFILAGSADNRLRVWRLVSKNKPRINPIVATRFIDESPIVNFRLTPDGKGVVVLSEGGNVKFVRTSDWNQEAVLQPLPDTGSDLWVSLDSRTATISLMNGQLVERQLPKISATTSSKRDELSPIYMDLGELAKYDESALSKDRTMGKDAPLAVGRGAEITGTISKPGESDEYRWQAHAGEVWTIDADKVDKSPLDTIVTVLDAGGQPVLRTRLQAVRDSYFTFRGKDSDQVGDFRIFNWQEMNLSQYLYASGEVTRLWLHPRGPDSGFNVYPGEGKRWTYFGTSHTAHALGEPAYIVQPLPPGSEPIANGLPVFDVYYQNDDDPMRMAGTNSRLLFTAPADGLFTVRIADTRGEGGDAYKYRLSIRPAQPMYKPTVSPANGELRKGTGREFTVRVDRLDGFDGPVTFEIPDLPPQIKANVPLVIEPGQRFAVGTLWVSETAEAWEGKIEPEIIAWAMINGKRVERKVGKVGALTLGDVPNVIPSIQPIDGETAVDEDWTLQVRRGETVMARLVIRRKEAFNAEVGFGKEDSGRNASQGVYVDNIGLNGLIVLKNSHERKFFLTADISAVPGKRSFFLRAQTDGNVTSHPITVEVLP